MTKNYTRNVNNVEVLAFKISGIKETTNPISFTIENKLTLKNKDNADVVKTFPADFLVQVKGVSYYPELMQKSGDALTTRDDISLNESTNCSSN